MRVDHRDNDKVKIYDTCQFIQGCTFVPPIGQKYCCRDHSPYGYLEGTNKRRKKDDEVQSTETRRRVNIQLPFKLTDEEILERAREAARLSSEVENIQNELKAIQKDFHARMKAMVPKMRELQLVVGTGEEKREVEAIELKNYSQNTVQYFYDSKLVVEREMNDEDDQLALA